MLDDQVYKKLNPQRQIFSIFGSICKNPSLLRSVDNPLVEDDFFLQFHKIVFKTIHNLVYSAPNLKHIDALDIDNYLKPFPKYYKIWTQTNGANFISAAIKNSNEELFDNDYETVKKYALLRKYLSNGIDVSDLYNYKSDDLTVLNDSAEKIGKMNVSEIIDHYTNKIIDIRNENNANRGDIVKFDINEDIDTLLQRLSESPEMGYPFVNPYYNSLFRGMREGKYMLRSGDTGTGKTRQAIRDMCNVACDSFFDITQGKWISSGVAMPVLFISTELNKQELQVLTLAYISGISSSKIEAGDYDKTTLKRLQQALQIIKRSKMHFVYIEEFSANDIEMLIEEYVIRYGIKYCVFDYIQGCSKLTQTFQKAFGRQLREDEVIFNLSKRLKALAEKYNIFIISSTQLNAKSKEENVSNSRDANVLRGSRATADKADYGILTFRVNERDKKMLKIVMGDNGFYKKPNFAHWIYKNRAGLDHIVIWSYMDLGTMREQVCFVTDYNYELIDLPKITGVVTNDNNSSQNNNISF